MIQARETRFTSMLPLCAMALLLIASVAEAQNNRERPRLRGTPLPPTLLGAPAGNPGEDAGASFLHQQLRYQRVDRARAVSEPMWRALFLERELPYPPAELYLRAFKHERKLEVWVRPAAGGDFTLLKEYAVCDLSGTLGPKRQVGDLQVPEGVYFIDEFNPRSSNHLSLRLNYPNIADRLTSPADHLGSGIYIHGGCGTVGCLPIEDHNIAELYWLALRARAAGQRLIPVHVFPARMDPEWLTWLIDMFRPDPDLAAFWKNLADVYRAFEVSRQVPWVVVQPDGSYAVSSPPDASAAR